MARGYHSTGRNNCTFRHVGKGKYTFQATQSELKGDTIDEATGMHHLRRGYTAQVAQGHRDGRLRLQIRTRSVRVYQVPEEAARASEEEVVIRQIQREERR